MATRIVQLEAEATRIGQLKVKVTTVGQFKDIMTVVVLVEVMVARVQLESVVA